jgi:hypothetical protein
MSQSGSNPWMGSKRLILSANCSISWIQFWRRCFVKPVIKNDWITQENKATNYAAPPSHNCGA